MSFVIIPKTAAEVNQLVSLLHSHDCKNLLANHNPDPNYLKVRTGKPVIFWGDYTYATGIHEGSTTIQNILDSSKSLTVNELGAYLN